MAKMDFSKIWIKWIKVFYTNAATSVLINSHKSQERMYTQDLHKDPLFGKESSENGYKHKMDSIRKSQNSK